MSRNRKWSLGTYVSALIAITVTLGGVPSDRARAEESVGNQASALVIDVAAQASAARAFSDSFLGLNGNNTQAGPAWKDTRLLNALAAFRPGTIRYPGGTIGNYWAWRAGWFQPGQLWPGSTDDDTGQPLPRFDNSLSAFKSAVTATGALPVFVVNMLTIDGRLAADNDNTRLMNDQIAFLKQAAAMGLPVSRIELGNEFYLDGAKEGPHGSDYATRFANARAYATQANPWIAALRSEFPDAKLAAVGDNASLGSFSARREGWNSAVLSNISPVDALTMHPYVALRDATLSHRAIISAAHKTVRTLRANELSMLRSRGMKAWITEFNMKDLTPEMKFAGTWAHGLFNSTMTLLLLQDSAVQGVDVHNVLGPASVATFFNSTDGFGSPTPATTYLGLSASGTALKSLMTAMQNAGRVQTLSFPGGPSLATDVPAVVGAMFSSGSTKRAFIVNSSADTVRLSISAIFTGAVSYLQQRAASLATRVTGPSLITTRNGTATGTVDIEPGSVMRLSQ